MPAYNKSLSSNSKKTDPCPVPTDEPDDQYIVADQDISTRAGKRKAKNALKQSSSNNLDHADKPTATDQMPPSNTSILGQLQHGFSQNKKSTSQDALNDLSSTQKVSDESTPPLDVWSRGTAYGRSPPVEVIPGLSISESPRIEPGFSNRGPLGAKSPPISPPLRKARPVSYGGGIPPLPSHPRISTSPYGYSQGAYGSPPIPPHLPQHHFYGPHDVDLNLVNPDGRLKLQEPTTLKISTLSGCGQDYQSLVFLAVEGGLSILSSTGERLEQVGALHGIPGNIVDACFLTWSGGFDPLAQYRPLVAVTLHGVTKSEPDSSSKDYRHSRGSNDVYETRVVIYSLTKACQVSELLRFPSPMTLYSGGQLPAANLKLNASGNFVTVTSGVSGEIYIFTIRRSKDSGVFECLGKFWTTVQPHAQRRDSSHGRTPDGDVSPADLGRGPESGAAPIISLNGRWLAYCPASNPSTSTDGAILGDFVVHNKNSHVTNSSAPPRPHVNCEVDSPDAETFLSKVAKGFAQEAVKSAKWISEKGMQTWQSYWKRENASPNNPASTSSSPPVFSPQLGVTQFPPTHANDSLGGSRDLEIVTIVDLKLLQDNAGRRTAESSLVATFQPPNGCSFLAFAPNGLSLMTANRKGDVQYIWDLMQIKYNKLADSSAHGESGRVRQIARYERLSPSTIVDVAWDGPGGNRFALLTKNRTIHVFDLPRTAFQWPPPRAKKHRPMSVSIDNSQVRIDTEPTVSAGFLASARNLAGRTQPMLANLRGRAPSVTGGISGIGASGIGLASTTGIKGGRAVAAGLSKSLGAASESVTSIRHAHQSRLHLKTAARPGMLIWQQREGRSVLSVLEAGGIKSYYVRMTKPRENREKETVTVFDARKATATKLPKVDELVSISQPTNNLDGQVEELTGDDEDQILAFWKPRVLKEAHVRMPHPLASAEIETNAPFQPLHSDHRISVSMLRDTRGQSDHHNSPPGGSSTSLDGAQWVFGNEMHAERFAIRNPHPVADDTGSVIYRETTLAVSGNAAAADLLEIADEGVTQVVSNTKKKKKKSKTQTTFLGDDDISHPELNFSKQDRGYDSDLDSRETSH